MRRSWIILGSVALCLALAGCTKPYPTTKATKVAPTTLPPRACANDQIAVKYGGGLAGHGDQGAVILFTNVSPIPCTLTGYPVVIAVDSANSKTPLRETPSGPLGGLPSTITNIPVVYLSQDATASSSIEAAAHPTSSGGACPRYSSVLVGLPGGSPVYQLPALLPDVGLALSACDPPPQVHPLFAGFNGYPSTSTSTTYAN